MRYELQANAGIFDGSNKIKSSSFVYLVHKANELMKEQNSLAVRIWEIDEHQSNILVAERKQNTGRNDWEFVL